jgi:hypothetical protein
VSVRANRATLRFRLCPRTKPLAGAAVTGGDLFDVGERRHPRPTAPIANLVAGEDFAVPELPDEISASRRRLEPEGERSAKLGVELLQCALD